MVLVRVAASTTRQLIQVLLLLLAIEEESDSKKAATGQGIIATAAQAAPVGAPYPGQALPTAPYAPQYGVPM